MKAWIIAAIVLGALVAVPARAQGPSAAAPADDMQVLREKLKEDKRAVVSVNLPLTESEAKAFWPLYDEYQRELQKINERVAMVIVTYAQEYGAQTLTDRKARALLDQVIETEEAEVRLKRAFLPRLDAILPGQKVARYMQLENKIRVLVKYEIAAEVPLVR